MGERTWLEALLATLRLLVELFWIVASWLFDLMRDLGPLSAGAIILAMLAMHWGLARLMQWRLNTKLSQAPDEPVNLILHELLFTLPVLIVLLILSPLLLLLLAMRNAALALKGALKRKKKPSPQDDPSHASPGASASPPLRAQPGQAPSDQEDKDKDKDKDEDEDAQEHPPGPVLVATLAPSLLFSAIALAGLYVLGLLTEPLLRLQLGLSPGSPAWEFWIIGGRPELQWYLPLSRYPWQGAALVGLFWITLWVWLARLGRLLLYKRLGVNLIHAYHDPSTLPWWRDLVGAPELWRVHDTYSRWAKWMPLVAAPLLAGGWLSMAADPYRMSPSMFILASLLALSWWIHLRLEGLLREPEPEQPPEQELAPIVAHAWPQVLDDLKRRLHIQDPPLFEPPRRVEPLAHSQVALEREGVLSPMLTELVPSPHKLTHMQHVILRDLSLQGYVHTDPPMPRGELDLRAAPSSGVEDRSGLRHRNQIVLAPEGSGRSSLAMLAACNHAIIHTRSSLIITRDNDRAERLFAMMRSRIEPSTLRWNIRERRVGADLVNDLAQGIIPDIIVCSLHQLVVNVLDEPQTYSPFLQNVGLIILDDVEDFAGPVELHAQLALRRLNLRLRELLGVAQLGEHAAPMMLILGADSMQEMPAWARTLCGVDAVSRYFDYSNEEASARDAAMMAFHGIQSDASPQLTSHAKPDAAAQHKPDAKPNPKPKQASPSASVEGRHHVIYRLHDLRDADDQSLDVRDVIESCERLSVPWHYRPCGDERRHLGRARLHLRDEPKLYVHDPAEAGVIFLEGCYSEVQRELRRLNRAGIAYSPLKQAAKPEDDEDNPLLSSKKRKKAPEPSIPIALITLIDRDEEMALTELNAQSNLAMSLLTLPRPIVRPPTGQVVHEHMAAELTNTWLEVKDVLDIFGNPSARTLMRLADHNMLMSERRVDLHPDVQQYEHRVYVRATSRALGAPTRAQRRAEAGRQPILPPKVAQVELPSGDSVAVRDRTNLTIVDRADSASAGYVYYLGRIFQNAMGRFVVVGRGAEEDDEDASQAQRDDAHQGAQDILVEPFLGEGISSPRRRSWFKYLEESPASASLSAPTSSARTTEELLRELDEGFAPAIEPVLIGRFPIGTALARVECATRHIATCRLGPSLHELRQRTVYDPVASRRHQPATMQTIALILYPNPEVDFVTEEPAPTLAMEEARLIASAMRAVLPSMYRGASSSLEVALHVRRERPGPEDPLTARDGFFLFDPSPGGNGAARALHRDGVELLLRLCRVYIERVLYHDRLRARYDYWGDEVEIMTDSGDSGEARPLSEDSLNVTGTWFVDLSNLNSPVVRAGDAVERSASTHLRLHDQEVRRRALIWLDSRLRPEGSLAGGRALGKYGSGNEEGEGDPSDIGRCWFSRGGGVTDLLWAKHRWRLDDEGAEAMADLGFDRDTAAASRYLTAQSPSLEPWLKPLSEQLQHSGFILPEDSRVWGSPRPLWAWSAGQDEPSRTDEALLEGPLQDYQLLIGAVAALDFKPLKPLAYLLRSRSGAHIDTVEGRYALIHYLAKFVQGIPSTAPTQPRGAGRTPVHTLLHRLGDCDSKSLILAILLRHCGVNSGLFVSLEGRSALCAVAALEGSADKGGDAARAQQSVAAWREMMGLEQESLIWADLPQRPGGPKGPIELYVPVDPMSHQRPGLARLDQPQQWAFVPLAPVWFRIGAEQDEDDEPLRGGVSA